MDKPTTRQISEAIDLLKRAGAEIEIKRSMAGELVFVIYLTYEPEAEDE